MTQLGQKVAGPVSGHPDPVRRLHPDGNSDTLGWGREAVITTVHLCGERVKQASPLTENWTDFQE